MAIKTIRVNTNQLKTDVEKVAESIHSMTTEVGKLENAYHALDAMWDGPASEVFKSVYEHDIEELKEAIKALEKYNVFENGAREKYDTCESEVNSIVGSLRV